RFLKFIELVGSHGEMFIQNLEPDEQGLAEAKRRMREHYANETTLQFEVQTKLDKLTPAKSEINVKLLRQNLETCESLITSLTQCGFDINVLNYSLYSLVASKFPFSIITDYTEANKRTKNLLNLITYIRKKMENRA